MKDKIELYTKKFNYLLVNLFMYVEKQLLGAQEGDDTDDEDKKIEQDHHRNALSNKFARPDVLAYETGNIGLKPFITSLKMAKRGENALEHYEERQRAEAAYQTENYVTNDLVNPNVWLSSLEQSVQKLSKHKLSLYDFQN